MQGKFNDPNINSSYLSKNHQPYYDLGKLCEYHRDFRWYCEGNCEVVDGGFRLNNGFLNSSSKKRERTELLQEFTENIKKYTVKRIKCKLTENNNKTDTVNLSTLLFYIDSIYFRFWSHKNDWGVSSSQFIDCRFKDFNKLLRLVDVPKGMTDDYTDTIRAHIDILIDCVNTRTLKDVHYEFEKYYLPLTQVDVALMNAKEVPIFYHGRCGFTESDYLTKDYTKKLQANIQPEHRSVFIDRDSAIIGTDSMRQIRGEDGSYWFESRAITAKIGSYTKLDRYISKQYKTELEYARSQCFTGKNNFTFEKRCNNVIGYCVEYYSKYLLYGPEYLYPYIDKARSEGLRLVECREVIIRACMLKYKALMTVSFGKEVAKIIPTISAEQLLKYEYGDFVNLVIELGQRTANYVKSTLYSNREPADDTDPNLSVLHISGLADYITPDTILDVKVRNNIDEKCVRQVLAYHYLSTKRSDLNIKRVIVYDASSDRAVVVPIEPNNQKSCKGN